MTMNKEAALVVFSGGQDSTTCLFWAKKHFKEVYALSFIYGQKHVKEVELARGIAERAGVHFHAMDVSFIGHLGKNSLTDTSIVMDEEKPEGSFPNTFQKRDVTREKIGKRFCTRYSRQIRIAWCICNCGNTICKYNYQPKRNYRKYKYWYNDRFGWKV